jgi:hypothetical protein
MCAAVRVMTISLFARFSALTSSNSIRAESWEDSKPILLFDADQCSCTKSPFHFESELRGSPAAQFAAVSEAAPNSAATPRVDGAYMEVEMDLKHVEGNWKKAVALASAVMVGVLLLSGGAEAQVTPQTIELAKIDVQKLSAGYRASKVIGSSVVNDANEFIGKIDDLLVSIDGKEPYAVLSVGGFLGMGTHLVVVPYDTLKFAEKKVVLPGGTKDGLRMLPEFKYATD